MINFERFTLPNGLVVLVNEDPGTPLVAMNVLYKVGARDEHEDKTGFAHLFEHLMFGGSANIPNYDEPLEKAGGENNAFTNNDITNYYLTIPAQNIETAFWLESDRMAGLAFSDHSLEVQRRVVVEEFKQNYLNYPYGDAWLLLKPLAYKVHPYRWNTIGKEVSHIENATMHDVRDFFGRFYHPLNAVLSVSGNVKTSQVRNLCEKWFGPIATGRAPARDYPAEPGQHEKRTRVVHRPVPGARLYKVYHCCARTDPEFHATDLLADILSKGHASRLHNSLVRNRQVFTEIHAYHSGDLDKGLLVFEGRLVDGVSMEDAEAALMQETAKLTHNAVPDAELTKAKQMAEAMEICSEIKNAHRALNLSFYEMLGDASQVNHVTERYNEVTGAQILEVAGQVLAEDNSSVLYYHPQHANGNTGQDQGAARKASA